MTQPVRWQLDPRTASAFEQATAAAMKQLGGAPGRVLEAGAGTQSHVCFPTAGSVVGIDENRLAIDRLLAAPAAAPAAVRRPWALSSSKRTPLRMTSIASSAGRPA